MSELMKQPLLPEEIVKMGDSDLIWRGLAFKYAPSAMGFVQSYVAHLGSLQITIVPCTGCWRIFVYEHIRLGGAASHKALLVVEGTSRKQVFDEFERRIKFLVPALQALSWVVESAHAIQRTDDPLPEEPGVNPG